MNFNFIFKSFILIFLSGLYSITINIPGDYSTIQEGIDVAVDGDTVLVADGDYQENIEINKSIVLASHAIFDDLDDWVAYDDVFYEQWVINNSHIANTRIIGNNPGDDYGSAILITPNEDTCISPEITGFTIQYGLGTLVERDDNQVRIGGGILADISDPLIKYNAFVNNGNLSLASGGAIQLTSGSEDWSFNDRENRNPRCEVEEFRISDNLYDDNDALYGNSVANRFHEDSFDMSGSIFDVFNCGAELENSISSIWVDVEDEATVDYSESEGNLCAFTAPDVYVDPSIDQECLEEGCGFQTDPYKTIARTLEMILPTDNNPITIHLGEGIYSPDRSESFPILMINNINFQGESQENTILDGLGISNYIFNFTNTSNNILSDLTVKSSVSSAINVHDSDLIIERVTISNNGIGLSIDGSNDIILRNINLTQNQTPLASSSSSNNNIILQSSQITENTRGMAIHNGNYRISDSNFENNVIHAGSNADNSFPSPVLETTNTKGVLINVDIKNNIYEGTDNDDASFLNINGALSTFLKNVNIVNNIGGNGIASHHGTGDLFLSNVTIANNDNIDTGVFYSIPLWYTAENTSNRLTIINSILDGYTYISPSSPASLLYSHFEYLYLYDPEYVDTDEIIINYVNLDFFVDPENGNYALTPISTSPFIDSGSPDYWSMDLDGTRSDRGSSGGAFVYPYFPSTEFDPLGYTGYSSSLFGPDDGAHFTEYDFGQIGGIENHVDFALYNYRDTEIRIDGIAETENFYTNINFPLIIEPGATGIIPIITSPAIMGEINELITIEGPDLFFEPILGFNLGAIRLLAEGVEGNAINGSLSGTLPPNTYLITGDIFVDEGDTLYLSPGTQFLFNEPICLDWSEWDDDFCITWSGPNKFFINGVLKAEGTEQDSIIFDNLDNSIDNESKWRAMIMYNQTPATIFNYVRISGIYSDAGSGGEIGSIQLHFSNPTLNNMVISGNSGGSIPWHSSEPSNSTMYLYESSPNMNNVLFNDNYASAQSGPTQSQGTAIGMFYSNPLLNNVTISNNGWGAVSMLESNPIITNSLITDNAPYAIKMLRSNPIISNSIITNNDLGAIYIREGSSPQFINTTIADNHSEEAMSAIFYFGDIWASENLIFTNSIIWNNGINQIDLQYSSHGLIDHFNISFSDIDLGWDSPWIWGDEGEGNIYIDPLFTDSENGDYSLQEGSPCIDTGTADTDGDEVDDITDYIGLAPDMGAFEYGATDDIVLGDANSDGVLDILDIVLMINMVLGNEYNEVVDINEDGVLNILDIVLLANIILNQ